MGKAMLETIITVVKKLFSSSVDYDPLIEGLYADDYTNQEVKTLIKERYLRAHPVPVDTPETHPWKYDPLNPPKGWRYDPYYELWLKTEAYQQT